MSAYPHRVGDFWAISPEIISTTERPEPGTVLNWAGENFTVQLALPDQSSGSSRVARVGGAL